MGTEIERKFLVGNDDWRQQADTGRAMRQGYLAYGPPVSVRVRICEGHAKLNMKRATLDIAREEFEYPIPLADGEHLLNELCQGYIIEKTRYKITIDGHVWEVDVFTGLNTGLVIAEIELSRRDETFAIPSWISQEVSGDARYLNSSLSRCPYSQW